MLEFSRSDFLESIEQAGGTEGNTLLIKVLILNKSEKCEMPPYSLCSYQLNTEQQYLGELFDRVEMLCLCGPGSFSHI